MGPSAGISEQDSSVGNLFGHRDPGKEKNLRKEKKKASKGGTDRVVSKTVDACLPVLTNEIALTVYVTRFIDYWTSRSALGCHCGGPQNGAWLQEAVRKL